MRRGHAKRRTHPRGKAQFFRGLKEEDPRLRLRGSIPKATSPLLVESRDLTLRPSHAPQIPLGEAPPAADPGVWFGRKMASLYERSGPLSSSSVK